MYTPASSQKLVSQSSALVTWLLCALDHSSHRTRWLKDLSAKQACIHPCTSHMVAERRCCSAASLVEVLVPLIREEIAKVVKTVLQEQISERIRKQIVEQATEVPKTSSRDRTLQRAVEQILDVPVPEMVTQLLEVRKIIPQDKILQRTVKQAETNGADGQTHSLFQESSSAALQTSTDLKECSISWCRASL